MAGEAPKCQRMCGRDSAWDSEGAGSWFGECSPCLFRAALHVKPVKCLHFGSTPGRLVPAYGTCGDGVQLGWLCTGYGADRCGRVYGLDGEELFYGWVFQIYRDRGSGPLLWDTGHASTETMETWGRRWVNAHGGSDCDEVRSVAKVFTDGPMDGQVACSLDL